MSCCDKANAKPSAQANGLVGLVTGPRRWWLFGALGVAAGLTLGWEQLVFFGIAPVLISLLPCLVMCGLGLCMMKCKGKTGTANDGAVQPSADLVSNSSGKQPQTATVRLDAGQNSRASDLVL